jgi:hypothetical protein
LVAARLGVEGRHVKYDPKQRYYLIAQKHEENDGGPPHRIVLTLTPGTRTPGPRYYFDTPDPEQEGLKVDKRVTLPRLSTGTGVNIGDTPQQVRRKLGTVPHHEGHARKRQARLSRCIQVS